MTEVTELTETTVVATEVQAGDQVYLEGSPEMAGWYMVKNVHITVMGRVRVLLIPAQGREFITGFDPTQEVKVQR